MANGPMLLVEGKDDKHVTLSLLQHHKVPETFQVKETDGIDSLLENLTVRLLLTDQKRLGVVVDADLSVESRWDAIIARLRVAGYEGLPDKPIPGGTIITPPDDLHPVVGVWIMPDNLLPGLLEDFVKFLVPAGDPLFDRARGCVSGIPPEQRRFPSASTSKAELHTWLAWQEYPGRPLGQAITTKYLNPESEHAVRFVAWLKQLFPPT